MTTTDGYTCTLCNGERTGDTPVIKSDGMGVESAAINLRWFDEPDTRDFCLCQLVILTSQVGEEHDDTKRLMETYMLPLYRRHHIRFVEVARGGRSQADGIVVLQDTREPYVLHTRPTPELPYYTLGEELLGGGTVPQFGGEHRCALKFKGFVIETWIEQYFKPARFRHVFGYNSDEQRRADNCTAATRKRNEAEAAARPAAADPEHTVAVFGFNAGETGRADRARTYDAAQRRTSTFPLLDWGWDREACEAYIELQVGERWEKSACVFCPFNSEASKQTPRGMARFARHPQATADALMIEHMSLALNPRGLLYAKLALREIVNPEASAIFDERLTQAEWSLYRVRRIYSKKGKADRCVEVTARGTREEMQAQLRRTPGDRDSRLGIDYVYLQRRVEDVYPAREEFYVAAPAYVDTKARYGVAWFEAKWTPAGAQLGLLQAAGV